MSIERPHFTRKDLIAALERNWKPYVLRLQALPEEEQARFAQEQGYDRVQDLLAHIFSWWESSMQRAQIVLDTNQPPPPTLEQDEFNAEVVARYRQWERSAIEAKFTSTLAMLEHFIVTLPEAVDAPEPAIGHSHIMRWMRIEAIEHYEEHRLPVSPNE